MSAFAGAVRTMFRDRNMTVPAVWHPPGADPVELRAMRKSPDVGINYGEGTYASGSTIVDVMVEAAPSIAIGHRLTIGSDEFVVQAEPMRDRERLTWTLNLRPVPPIV